jgi:hypothetical protein
MAIYSAAAIDTGSRMPIIPLSKKESLNFNCSNTLLL